MGFRGYLSAYHFDSPPREDEAYAWTLAHTSQVVYRLGKAWLSLEWFCSSFPHFPEATPHLPPEQHGPLLWAVRGRRWIGEEDYPIYLNTPEDVDALLPVMESILPSTVKQTLVEHDIAIEVSRFPDRSEPSIREAVEAEWSLSGYEYDQFWSDLQAFYMRCAAERWYVCRTTS